MTNGGIYFIVAKPTNEGETGIARYNDVQIRNCSLNKVNRWVRFFATELSTQSQLEKLLKENMPNGKEAPKQSLEQIRIDWNKYM